VIPSLSTQRLRLRAFREADHGPYAAMCADEDVMRHIGAGGPVDADVAWRQMALFLGAWALRGHGMWALEERDSKRLIGRVGFIDPPGWPGCELGWLLARDYGRDALGLGDLISLIRPDNTRSIALALRLGATLGETIQFMEQACLVYRHPGA
jgi:RimJ/RimL family protein N-acetyltransferase